MSRSINILCLSLFLFSSFSIGSQGATEIIEAQKHQDAKNIAQNKRIITAPGPKIVDPEQTFKQIVTEASDQDKKAKL